MHSNSVSKSSVSCFLYLYFIPRWYIINAISSSLLSIVGIALCTFDELTVESVVILEGGHQHQSRQVCSCRVTAQVDTTVVHTIHNSNNQCWFVDLLLKVLPTC